LGFPDPVSVAVDDATLVAAVVTAVAAPEVVNVSTAPNATPSVLATIAQ
jgi:hypothetical protein